MKGYVKAAAVLIICVISVCVMTLPAGIKAFAEETENIISDDLLKASGAADITDDVDSDVKDVLDKYGITVNSPDAAGSFGISEITELVYSSAVKEITSPLRVFVTLAAVIVFTAFAEASKCGLKGGMDHMSSLVTSMAGAAAAMPDICSCFLRVRETISQSSDFMTSFTPVFAGIIITSGSPGAGICYNTAVYAIVNIIIQVIDKALLPMLSMCLALSITDSVTKDGSAGGLQRLMKTVVTWSLGFLMTIFIGVLSVQGIVRSTADNFTTKTARYVVSNFVPFVGGAVSDAYSTVLGSLKILKSCTGFVGIVTLLILFLPVFLELSFYRLAIGGAAAISEFFDAGGITKLLRGIETALKMTFSVLVCFSVMFLVAIAAVLLITGNTYA
ncbi:MAG: hypothetical protein ACI4JN_04070 [Ruminococcus sp.]